MLAGWLAPNPRPMRHSRTLVFSGIVRVSDTILFHQADGIAQVTFNHPARRNALGAPELAAIEAALSALSEDSRVLMITSADPRVFCAGADITQILEGSLSGERWQMVTNQIAELPIPTIAVLSGNVFGGGVELAMSCDFRLAREDISMRIPAAAIGLCYPVMGIERLTRRLGINLAKRALVAAESFSGASLLTLGLVDSLHTADTLAEAAEGYARSLLALAPMSVTTMLALIRQLEIGGYDRVAADAMAQRCAQSEDLQEGLKAMREKRSPVFRNV